MRQLLITTLLGLLAGFTLSACGQTIEVPEDLGAETVVLNYAWTGGCARAGRCRQVVIYADGRFEFRPMPSKTEDEILSKGQLRQSVIDSWLETVSNTNIDRLTASLSPGTCQGCTDGIDTHFIVFPASSAVALSSAEFTFDPSKPFFEDTFGLIALTMELQEIVEPEIIPIVLTYTTSGACGPELVSFCPKAKLYADGSCQIIRPYEDGDQPVNFRQIPEADMTAWQSITSSTDFDALKASLPPGRNGFPFKDSDRKGPDIHFEMTIGDETVTLSSKETGFDHTLPIFENLRALSECFPINTKLRQNAFWLSPY